MENKYIRPLKEEFGMHLKYWTDISLQRNFWYLDQEIKNIRDQRNMALAFSTISLAILGVLFGVIKGTTLENVSFFFFLSFFSLSIGSFLSAIFVFLGLWVDASYLPQDQKKESDVYLDGQNKATKVLQLLYNGESDNKITEAITDYHNIKNDIKGKTKNSRLERLSKFMQLLFKIFLFLFFLGFVSFVFELIKQFLL